MSLFVTASGVGAVVASDGGLVEVMMPDAAGTTASVRHALAQRHPGLVGDNDLTRTVAEQLTRYFSGVPVTFQCPLDEEGFTPFQKDVYRVVRAIPAGAVMSYGEVAAAVGRPGAARGVGGAMAMNPVPVIVPCHRVVGSGGRLTGYSAPGGIVTKKQLLSMEGADPAGNRAAGA